MKNVFWIFLIFATGCASRAYKVLDAPWVSMKHAGPPESPRKLTKVGPVEERYCQTSWSGSYGLMDEVVKQAEEKQKLDYVADASFTEDDAHLCVDLVGEGYRQ